MCHVLFFFAHFLSCIQSFVKIQKHKIVGGCSFQGKMPYDGGGGRGGHLLKSWTVGFGFMIIHSEFPPCLPVEVYHMSGFRPKITKISFLVFSHNFENPQGSPNFWPRHSS